MSNNVTRESESVLVAAHVVIEARHDHGTQQRECEKVERRREEGVEEAQLPKVVREMCGLLAQSAGPALSG
jgi:hypothetical protein